MRLCRDARVNLRLALISAVLASACGSSSSSAPTTPASPTPTTPPRTFVNIAGTWTGSFKSSNYAERSVSMTVVQGGVCVDGVWSGSPSGWTGAISGNATETGYTGQISVEFTLDNGERCRGVSDVFSAPVGATELTWNVSAFPLAATCSQPLPADAIITLHRS